MTENNTRSNAPVLEYDSARARIHINGETYSCHSHNCTSLYLQLADDARLFEGERLLRESAEDAFYRQLLLRFDRSGKDTLAERVETAQQYHASMGLGQLRIDCAGLAMGEATLLHSHADEGWLRRFGKRETPINYITQGFLAAFFSATHGLPPRSYEVAEIKSIVTGSSASEFLIARR